MKTALVISAIFASSLAYAGSATSPGPGSAPAGSIIANSSTAKALSQAASSGTGHTVISVSPQAISSLNVLAQNPPAGASVTTSGSVTTILNVTLVVNGESVTVDISFDSDSNQVTITRA